MFSDILLSSLGRCHYSVELQNAVIPHNRKALVGKTSRKLLLESRPPSSLQQPQYFIVFRGHFSTYHHLRCIKSRSPSRLNPFLKHIEHKKKVLQLTAPLHMPGRTGLFPLIATR